MAETLRECPYCGVRTPTEFCPNDGTHTFTVGDADGGIVGIGSVIRGRYRLDAIVGEGGFGTVYRATQLSVDRPMALKLFHDDIPNDRATRRRIQREARGLANVKSAHLVSFLDFGQTATGRYFIATELLEGKNLGDLLDTQGSMAPKRVARLGMQICDALAACHDAGLVHRDVKPQNVMVDERRSSGEHATLFDLGIAKPTRDGDGEQRAQHLTHTGMVIGSPPYMSPEQCNGRPIGPASDVYSLGAVLYEMAAGRPPFEGPTNVDLLHAHVNKTPPPMKIGEDAASRALEQIIMRCLHKKPEDRPASAEELGEVLGSIAADRRSPTQRAHKGPHVSLRSAVGATTQFQRAPVETSRGWERGDKGLAYLKQVDPEAARALTLSESDLIEWQPKRRWGWLAAALLVLAGGVGGGYYIATEAGWQVGSSDPPAKSTASTTPDKASTGVAVVPPGLGPVASPDIQPWAAPRVVQEGVRRVAAGRTGRMRPVASSSSTRSAPVVVAANAPTPTRRGVTRTVVVTPEPAPDPAPEPKTSHSAPKAVQPPSKVTPAVDAKPASAVDAVSKPTPALTPTPAPKPALTPTPNPALTPKPKPALTPTPKPAATSTPEAPSPRRGGGGALDAWLGGGSQPAPPPIIINTKTPTPKPKTAPAPSEPAPAPRPAADEPLPEPAPRVRPKPAVPKAPPAPARHRASDDEL